MADVILVTVELEHECELRCFRIVALHQNALCVKLLTENRRSKVGCDECDLQIAVIACVVVDDIIHAVVGVEILVFAVRINAQGYSTGQAHRRCKCRNAVVRPCRDLSPVNLIQTEFNLILLQCHCYTSIS